MKQLMPAIKLFALLTVLTGILYPLFITLIAQKVFPEQANGSLLYKDGKLVGSALVAQKFQTPQYFWARPSAVDYNPMPSGGSNAGPTSADLKAKVLERQKLGLTDEMLFASASGLDPHISPAAAKSQVERIVLARKLGETGKGKLMQLIEQNTEQRQFGFLGEVRVNVLRLNLALDQGV